MTKMSDKDQPASVAGSGPARRVEVQRTVNASIDVVWNAITNSAEVGEWWQPAEIDKREAGNIRVFMGDAAMVDGTIKVFQPPYIFEFTWNDADENAGLVRFDLVELSNTTTRITVIQYVPVSEVIPAAAGWHSIIECLVAYLRTGKPAEFDKDSSRFSALMERLMERYSQAGTK